MNKITYTDEVYLPDDTRIISVSIDSSGVSVQLDDKFRPGYDRVRVQLPWAELEDTELLSVKFDTETVRTFRVLVQMLGKIHANKSLYEALV